MEKNEVNIIELLEYLQEILDQAPKVPITGKSIVDKDEFVEIIEQIVNYLPDQLKKAEWVLSEKDRLLTDAQKEYDEVKRETLELMKQQVENHDVVKEAKNRANEIIALAQRDAKVIRLGSRDYSNEILSQLDKEIEAKKIEMLNTMQNAFANMANDIDKNLTGACGTIKDNIAELRTM